MAKKNKKIEKETRRLIESISDLVKYKNDRYKFKTKKKKQIKVINTTCMHWVIKNGKVKPAVQEDPAHPGMFRCRICGKLFPIQPMEKEEYEDACRSFEALVNQAAFYSVAMGGNSDDTKLFITLKKAVPRFEKVIKNEGKALAKRKEYIESRKGDNGSGQFDSWSVVNYN